MPTKQVVLRASSAAAALFISNLSRCSAIGKAVRQASDDTFIQLGDTHIYPERDISAACDYGDAEGNLGTQASLIFGASDSFATKRIVCPKTDERNAFSASFGPRLHSFHEQGEEDLIFYETPPHNSGQDPVKDLDHSSYRERPSEDPVQKYSVTDLRDSTAAAPPSMPAHADLFEAEGATPEISAEDVYALETIGETLGKIAKEGSSAAPSYEFTPKWQPSESSKPPLNAVYCRHRFDAAPEDKSQLSAVKGDLLAILEQHASGWTFVRKSRITKGWLPDNVLAPLLRTCIVNHPYHAQGAEQPDGTYADVDVAVGDLVQLKERHASGWTFVKITDPTSDSPPRRCWLPDSILVETELVHTLGTFTGEGFEADDGQIVEVLERHSSGWTLVKMKEAYQEKHGSWVQSESWVPDALLDHDPMHEADGRRLQEYKMSASLRAALLRIVYSCEREKKAIETTLNGASENNAAGASGSWIAEKVADLATTLDHICSTVGIGRPMGSSAGRGDTNMALLRAALADSRVHKEGGAKLPSWCAVGEECRWYSSTQQKYFAVVIMSTNDTEISFIFKHNTAYYKYASVDDIGTRLFPMEADELVQPTAPAAKPAVAPSSTSGSGSEESGSTDSSSVSSSEEGTVQYLATDDASGGGNATESEVGSASVSAGSRPIEGHSPRFGQAEAARDEGPEVSGKTGEAALKVALNDEDQKPVVKAASNDEDRKPLAKAASNDEDQEALVGTVEITLANRQSNDDEDDGAALGVATIDDTTVDEACDTEDSAHHQNRPRAEAVETSSIPGLTTENSMPVETKLNGGIAGDQGSQGGDEQTENCQKLGTVVVRAPTPSSDKTGISLPPPPTFLEENVTLANLQHLFARDLGKSCINRLKAAAGLLEARLETSNTEVSGDSSLQDFPSEPDRIILEELARPDFSELKKTKSIELQLKILEEKVSFLQGIQDKKVQLRNEAAILQETRELSLTLAQLSADIRLSAVEVPHCDVLSAVEMGQSTVQRANKSLRGDQRQAQADMLALGKMLQAVHDRIDGELTHPRD
ncbi:hypothetical protein FOZ63_029917, partial [Perkinsus olseni]